MSKVEKEIINYSRAAAVLPCPRAWNSIQKPDSNKVAIVLGREKSLR
ncbi:hypothetical protein [Nostoc sp. UHCC 0252]|nr:hypothetical protein [Nostoc sp. UHCC 0252]MEA5601804.1 hypothetical protein [Nostoc sp. UHCC 0252]